MVAGVVVVEKLFHVGLLCHDCHAACRLLSFTTVLCHALESAQAGVTELHSRLIINVCCICNYAVTAGTVSIIMFAQPEWIGMTCASQQ